MVGWRRKGVRQGTDFAWERFPNSRFFACDFWVSKSSSYAVYVWKRLCFVSCDTRTRTRLAHAHTRALAHSHVHTQIYVHIYLYMRVCVVISLTDWGSRCTLECLQWTTISAQRQERILFRNVETVACTSLTRSHQWHNYSTTCIIRRKRGLSSGHVMQGLARRGKPSAYCVGELCAEGEEPAGYDVITRFDALFFSLLFYQSSHHQKQSEWLD